MSDVIIPQAKEDITSRESIRTNKCVICPFRSYVEAPDNAKTRVLTGKKGLKSCNIWAKTRKMPIKFKVRPFCLRCFELILIISMHFLNRCVQA